MNHVVVVGPRHGLVVEIAVAVERPFQGHELAGGHRPFGGQLGHSGVRGGHELDLGQRQEQRHQADRRGDQEPCRDRSAGGRGHGGPA